MSLTTIILGIALLLVNPDTAYCELPIVPNPVTHPIPGVKYNKQQASNIRKLFTYVTQQNPKFLRQIYGETMATSPEFKIDNVTYEVQTYDNVDPQKPDYITITKETIDMITYLIDRNLDGELDKGTTNISSKWRPRNIYISQFNCSL